MPHPNPPERWRLSLRGLFALVALIMIALGLWLQYRRASENRRLADENRKLSEEVADLKFERQLEQIVFRLKVPTEALYHAFMPRGDLDRLRWEALTQHGVEDEFVPLYELYEHTANSPRFYDAPAIRYDLEFWKSFHDSFWEGYAINHADDGADWLVGLLKHDDTFRRQLLSQPEMIEKYLQPLLLRMVRAPGPRARYVAIEALLLLGKPTGEVVQTLRESLERPEKPPPRASAVEWNKFHSWDPKEARRLIEEYQLQNLVRAE